MALVLRSENVLFDDWRHSRCFQFGINSVQIEQNWEGLGVAGVVWDAAISLSFYLWNHPELVKGKNILELGAGMGLCSIVIGLLGSSIISTDKANVIPLLRSNLFNNLNKINDKNLNPNLKCSNFLVKEFDWFNPPESLVDKSFDIIIGADLVYDVQLFPVLASVFRKMINNNNFILLSTRIRYEKDKNFITSLSSEYGFKVETIYHYEDRQVIISKIYI